MSLWTGEEPNLAESGSSYPAPGYQGWASDLPEHDDGSLNAMQQEYLEKWGAR